ncbi:SDR family oxidoreductase [Companilactobacillus kimchiensis]|uniref:NAD(P)-binding domain-containing protein n=1 Tax=Companilactobacillus kimchiensis TaxID=993692 RepID=A0A0R2LAM4_9LACO|nr:SDR family oxidoreductase [Companilactobacillus kimchiensis]KRN98898.1 hypothetical protein IV57_GL000708 [Companilactobacillus kimchiensis]
MKTIVIGASGRTGSQILSEIKKDGTQVVAGVRSTKKAAEFENHGIETAIIDIVNMTVDEIAEKLADIDSIVFASGASQAHPEQAMWIDLDGAVKVMQAAIKNHIEKFIMISAAGAEDRATWSIYDIPQYYIAKYYAEQYLKTSGLIYTVIRPAILTDDKAKKEVDLINNNNPRITRQDVALVTVEALKNEKFNNKSFNLYAGTTKISDIKPL